MSPEVTCRYALDPHHVCANRDGRTPPRESTDCFTEARAQVVDEALRQMREKARDRRICDEMERMAERTPGL